MVMSIIEMIILICGSLYLLRKWNDSYEISKTEVIGAVGFGIAVGLCNYFAPKGGAIAVICLIAMIALVAFAAYVIYNRCLTGITEEVEAKRKERDKSKEKEPIKVDFKAHWLAIFLLLIPISLTLNSAAAATSDLVQGAFWKSVILTLPTIVMCLFWGFTLLSYFSLKEKYDKKNGKIYNVAKWVVFVLAILLLILAFVGIKWSSIGFEKKQEVKELEPVVEELELEPVEVAPWYEFYNAEMILDDDTKNDYNFGRNPLDELMTNKVTTGELTIAQLANKTTDQLYGMVTAEDLEKEYRKRLAVDPALGAADMAWFDSIMGTRYLGVFYDECKGNWSTAINLAKERWMADQEEYNKTLAAYFAFLDTAEKVEVNKVTKGLDDQMYMNPYTVDHVPDVIVMESADHEGYFLTYHFSIKGKALKVSYRIDCGFQPTNVSKIMNITPEKNPNKPATTPTPTKKKSSGGGGKSGGGNTNNNGKSSGGTVNPGKASGGSSGGKSSGGDVITNPKDPTKGTDVGKNDTKGPGPDTNNGVGAIYSSEEKPTNSIHETYKEYKEDIQELKEINKNQKVGGDSNKPSTTVKAKSSTNKSTNNSKTDTKAETKVEEKVTIDSNADKGTGNGSIDKPTTVKEAVHVESNLGGSKSVADDPVGTEWAGPVD